MTRFLPIAAAAALLALPLVANAQTGGIPGGATQAPNPSPASSSISQPTRPMAPAPVATPAPAPMAAAPVTPAMPAKPMAHGRAKPMMHHHMAAKPMGKGHGKPMMARSRDSQDAAVDALNAQSLARAQGR